MENSTIPESRATTDAIRPHASSVNAGAATASVVRTVKKRAKKYAKDMPMTAPPAWTAARPSTNASSGDPATGVSASAIGRSGLSGSPRASAASSIAMAAHT